MAQALSPTLEICYLLLQRKELQRTQYKGAYGILKYFQKLNNELLSDIGKILLDWSIEIFYDNILTHNGQKGCVWEVAGGKTGMYYPHSTNEETRAERQMM